MSSPTTFLAVAVGGWIVLRVATAGLYPGAFAKPLDAEMPATVAAQTATPSPASPPPTKTVYVPYPVYLEGPATGGPRNVVRAAREMPVRDRLPPPAAARTATSFPPAIAYGSAAAEPWSVIGVALPPPRPGPLAPAPELQPRNIDRWQLASWALFRDDAATPSLSPNGMLGGSQAGTRLTWRFNDNLALSARVSAPANNAGIQGGEAALGVRYTPFASIPFSLTAERRQRLGNTGGRNDFALFAEGGIWDVPVSAAFAANGYVQAGAVGIEERDLFIDGSLTLTRPLIAGVDGGVGIWGGAQPGLSRLDIGPRLSMPLFEGAKLHVDWRQQVAGDADPGSGPVVSIGADF